MVNLLVLLAAAPSIPPAIRKADDYLRSAPSLSFKYTATAAQLPPVTGTLLVQGQKRLKFTARGTDIDFVLSISERGYLELDRVQRLYDEFPYQGRTGFAKTQIGEPRMFIPGFAMNQTLSGSLPPNSKWTKQTGAANSERWRASFETDFGVATVDADVAADGRILRLLSAIPGRPRTTWTFSNHDRPARPTLEQFAVSIPDGMSPITVSREFGPVPQASTLPDGALMRANGSSVRLASLTRGKVVLVAVLGRACDVSTRFARDIPQLEKALGGKATLVTLYDAPGSGLTAAKDLIDRLELTLTPTFLLVDAKGKIAQAWMGYEPGGREGVLREVGAAIKEL